jgi:hypothetical protein
LSSIAFGLERDEVGKVSSRGKCLILLCVVWVAACRANYTYQVPEQVDDGWQTASLEAVGLDGKLIARAVSRVLDGTYQNVHSILIVKDGKLVLETYFPTDGNTLGGER